MSECSIFRDWARINKLFWLLFTLGKNLVPSLEFQTESRPESWGANPFFVLLSVASSDLSQSFPNPNCVQYLAWVSQNIRGEAAAVTREKMILLLCSAWIINSRSPVLWDAGEEEPGSVWLSLCCNSSHPRIFTLRLISQISQFVLGLRRPVHDKRFWQYFEYHFTLTVLKNSQECRMGLTLK